MLVLIICVTIFGGTSVDFWFLSVLPRLYFDLQRSFICRFMLVLITYVTVFGGTSVDFSFVSVLLRLYFDLFYSLVS